MTEVENKALITVTFYFGDGENALFRLNKKYVLQGWDNEIELRSWLDEIATEMNYLSGYGILSIKIDADELKFSVDYRNRFVPYTEEPEVHINYYWFKSSLRFPAGEHPGKGKLWLEIPRLYITTRSQGSVEMHEVDDQLFEIKATAFKRRKEENRYSTRYRLSYDYDNPLLVSFTKKIGARKLAPHTTTPYKSIPYTDVEDYIRRSVSWWYLPTSQTTQYQVKKNREQEEKRKKAEEQKKQQLEKAGIVYKDRKQKKKAHQVYIIQMAGDGLADNFYKIGISHTPGKRLQSLNTSSPFKLKLVHKFVATPAEEAEAKLHEKYDKCRMSGEWFQLSPGDIVELRRITEYSNGAFIKE